MGVSTPTDQPRTPAGSPQGGQYTTNPSGEGVGLLPGHTWFTPNAAAVQTIIDRAKTLTPDETKTVFDMWVGVEGDPAWDEAWDEATNASSAMLRDSVLAAAEQTISDTVGDEAADAARDAILAETTRDLISEEHYNLLMTPWRAGVGS